MKPTPFDLLKPGDYIVHGGYGLSRVYDPCPGEPTMKILPGIYQEKEWFQVKKRDLTKINPVFTKFRQRVLRAAGHYELKSRWIAEALGANETRVSEALTWLEEHHYLDKA